MMWLLSFLTFSNICLLYACRSWNGCIWIELYDTTSESDVNIADALVEKGFAIRAQTFTETTMSDASASIKSEAIRSDGKSSVVMIPG